MINMFAWFGSVRKQPRLEEAQPAAWAEMAKAAASYCGWIESLPMLTPEERKSREVSDAYPTRTREARAQLLAVMTAASRLEAVDPPGDEESDYGVSSAAWQEVYKRTGALDLGHYRDCPYGEDLTDELLPSLGDVSDDLTDIWKDLKTGLLMWNEGKHASAVWEWHFQFTCHWGSHAVDALRQIQGWIQQHARELPDS